MSATVNPKTLLSWRGLSWMSASTSAINNARTACHASGLFPRLQRSQMSNNDQPAYCCNDSASSATSTLHDTWLFPRIDFTGMLNSSNCPNSTDLLSRI
jgi:hypothetical protein